MRPFKNLIFILMFLFAADLVSAQQLIDTHAGLYTTFLSSPYLKSTPGFGIEIGKRSQAKISPRFDFFTDYSIYFSTFTVDGYTWTENGSGTISDTKVSVPFFKIGLNYALGIDYFILPDQLSIGAGPAISINYIATTSTTSDSLGALPPPALVAVYPAPSTTDKFAGVLFDYGVHVNAVYRLPRMQFSISYFKGFNSLTPGFSTTSTDIMLAIHFNLRELSFAKPYQNKITK